MGLSIRLPCHYCSHRSVYEKMVNRINHSTALPLNIDTPLPNESQTSVVWSTTLHLLTSSAPIITNSSGDVIPNITVLTKPVCTEPGKYHVMGSNLFVIRRWGGGGL